MKSLFRQTVLFILLSSAITASAQIRPVTRPVRTQQNQQQNQPARQQSAQPVRQNNVQQQAQPARQQTAQSARQNNVQQQSQPANQQQTQPARQQSAQPARQNNVQQHSQPARQQQTQPVSQQQQSVQSVQTTQPAQTSTTSSHDKILANLAADMVYVEGGTFTMGATAEQGSDAYDEEKPAHQVTLSSFYICKHEVTQEEWEAVMGSNPSKFKGKRLPVETVSWNKCQTFIRKLNSLTGKQYRLPTEAEWEYAARGGNRSQGYIYSGSNTLSNVAWYYDNSGNKTHEVMTKSPSELGLYDMSGNVWEWCSDWYGNYSTSAQTNPKGASSGSARVARGGSWYPSRAGNCRVSYRSYFQPSNRYDILGLRLVL